MQKWEYCAIVGVSGGSYDVWASNSVMLHFTPTGKRITKIDKDDQDHLAKTIATLGQEGWEMIGAGNTDGKYHTLYFKRPLP